MAGNVQVDTESVASGQIPASRNLVSEVCRIAECQRRQKPGTSGPNHSRYKVCAAEPHHPTYQDRVSDAKGSGNPSIEGSRHLLFLSAGI